MRTWFITMGIGIALLLCYSSDPTVSQNPDIFVWFAAIYLCVVIPWAFLEGIFCFFNTLSQLNCSQE